MDKNFLLNTALATLVAMGVSVHDAQAADDSKPGFEKCYGISKKGVNDCGTKDHSCAGAAKRDADPEEWLYVPSGTCKKIVGGHLQPIVGS
jgi:uncharacterized membrane protein